MTKHRGWTAFTIGLGALLLAWPARPQSVIGWDRSVASDGDSQFVVTANADASADSAISFQAHVACEGCVLVSMALPRATNSVGGTLYFPAHPASADVWGFWYNRPLCDKLPSIAALFSLTVRATAPAGLRVLVRLTPEWAGQPTGSPELYKCDLAELETTYGVSDLVLRPGGQVGVGRHGPTRMLGQEWFDVAGRRIVKPTRRGVYLSRNPDGASHLVVIR